MKYLLLFIPFILNAWTFQLENIKTYNNSQLEVLRVAQSVGLSHDLDLTLMTLAIVETRAGKYDFKKNHICGPMQINTNFVTASCKELETSPYLSAKLAMANFKYWLKQTKGNHAKAVMHYNGGWNTTKHGKVYLKRFRLVLKELQANPRYLEKLLLKV